MTDEKEFYAEIRDNYKQQEKAINDWTEYVARTSNYKVLAAAKAKQEQSVDASRINVKQKPGLVITKLTCSLLVFHHVWVGNMPIQRYHKFWVVTTDLPLLLPIIFVVIQVFLIKSTVVLVFLIKIIPDN